jgi:hypothetical protein
MASGFVIKCCVSIVAKSGGSNSAAGGPAAAHSAAADDDDSAAADSAAAAVADTAADIVAHSANDTAAHNTTAASSCSSPCDTHPASPAVIGRLFTFPQPLLRRVSWDDLAEDDFIAVPRSQSVTVNSETLPQHIPYSFHAPNLKLPTHPAPTARFYQVRVITSANEVLSFDHAPALPYDGGSVLLESPDFSVELLFSPCAPPETPSSPAAFQVACNVCSVPFGVVGRRFV